VDSELGRASGDGCETKTNSTTPVAHARPRVIGMPAKLLFACDLGCLDLWGLSFRDLCRPSSLRVVHNEQVHMGTVMPGGSSSWSASCFTETAVTLTLSANGTGGTVTFTGTKPSSLLCSDVYLLMTNFHVR
jgi:hypothetical protein